MARATWVTGLVLATAVFVGSGPAVQTTGNPQQQSTPQAAAPKAMGPMLVMLRITDVKPDMKADFDALQKSDILPGLKKAVEWRDFWRSAVGSTYTVASVTPLKSMADLDGGSPLEKSMGKDAFGSMSAKLAKLITASHVYIVKTRPDLGYQGEGAGSSMAKLGVLADVEVMPGRQPDFEAILKTEWVAGLKKANVPSYSVSEVVLGGAIGEYYTFTPVSNFAALDKGHPILQSLGEAGLNRLMAKMGTNIRRADRIVIQYDDDLSFHMPATPKTTSQ